MRKPPAIPTYLLLALGPRDDAVMGDLLEEYAEGRSCFWFVRQAAIVILVGPIRLAVTHPVRTFAPSRSDGPFCSWSLPLPATRSPKAWRAWCGSGLVPLIALISGLACVRHREQRQPHATAR
jgi:hypothetical protein